jgi:hypothetical protein
MPTLGVNIAILDEENRLLNPAGDFDMLLRLAWSGSGRDALLRRRDVPRRRPG